MIEKVILGSAVPLLGVAALVVLGLPSRGSDSAVPPPVADADAEVVTAKVEGDPIQCAGGVGTVVSLERAGDRFRVVGRLVGRGATSAVVDGPNGALPMLLTPPSTEASGFIVGDPVTVTGSVDEFGVYVATEMAALCQGLEVISAEPLGPLPTAAPESQPIAPVPAQPPAAPVPEATIAAEELQLDSADGERKPRDNEEHDNNGGGNDD